MPTLKVPVLAGEPSMVVATSLRGTNISFVGSQLTLYCSEAMSSKPFSALMVIMISSPQVALAGPLAERVRGGRVMKVITIWSLAGQGPLVVRVRVMGRL